MSTVATIDKVGEWTRTFERLAATLPGAAWVAQLRRQGIASFAELGFPTPRHEDWRQTSITPITARAWSPVMPEAARVAPVSGAEELFYPGSEAARLVFVDGHFAPRLSALEGAPEGLEVGSIGAILAKDPSRLDRWLGKLALASKHPFVALNTAFFQDGPFVLVRRGATLDRPVHAVYLSTGAAEARVNHPRALFVSEPGSKAVFVETFSGCGEGGSFANPVTEMVVGEEAKVEHVMLELETLEAIHVATHQVRIERGATLTTHSFSLGGALVRNELNCSLDGEGIWLYMNGLFRVDGRQHIDNHTSIDHLQPQSDSRELYKGLLDGRGKAVFHGKIIVRKNSQQTNAYQENRNLLLSDEAIVDTKPQLEIHANDVKCKHGANIGHVEEDRVHYLRSRGIPREEARRVLIHAFGMEMVRLVPVEAVRDRLARQVYRLLGGDPKDAVLWTGVE